MADESRDKTAEVLQGLDALVEAGKVAEVEDVLTTLIETEPEGDESAEERATRSYAEGMRDGIALVRGVSPSEAGSD